MTDVQKESLQVTQVLAKAVSAALERKRRLGQYAVIYRHGKLEHLSSEQLSTLPQISHINPKNKA